VAWGFLESGGGIRTPKNHPLLFENTERAELKELKELKLFQEGKSASQKDFS